MKFNKQINNGTLLIPGGAFKISGFEGGEKVEIHTLDSAVVVLKKQMTTMELIQATVSGSDERNGSEYEY